MSRPGQSAPHTPNEDSWLLALASNLPYGVPQSPHDALFKSTFSDPRHAEGALRTECAVPGPSLGSQDTMSRHARDPEELVRRLGAWAPPEVITRRRTAGRRWSEEGPRRGEGDLTQWAVLVFERAPGSLSGSQEPLRGSSGHRVPRETQTVSLAHC